MTNPLAGPAQKAEVFKADDGATLVGQVFYPPAEPRAVMILNGAVGVVQDYYRSFAAYAAETQGVIVFIYDYRDIGRSSTGRLRRSKATMADWGMTDQRAARDKMRRMFPGLPLWVMGHSLGGMTMPLHQDTRDIERMTCVASGNVHHGDHPWPYRLNALMFWFGIGPVLTASAGFLPAKSLGVGEDLPAAAYWQWRRWCTSKRTFGGEEGWVLPNPEWQAQGTDLRLIAFEDDQLVPVQSINRFAQDYGRTAADVEVISPSAFGLRSIGHIAAFARRNANVWDRLLSSQSRSTAVA